MSEPHALVVSRVSVSWGLAQLTRLPGQCLALAEVECRKLLRDPRIS